MANYSVTIETPDINLGQSFFSDFWAIIVSHKQVTEDEIKRLLQETAREDHDYTVRTGQLRASTKAEGSFNEGEEIRLYVDMTQQDYAEYIIQPEYYNDPFIDEALQRLMPVITELIQDLYNQAALEFTALP